MKNKKSFEKGTDELQQVFDFLKTKWEKFGIEQKERSEMELAVEEIFMNMVRHNSEIGNEIELTVEKKAQSIKITLSDREVVPFDITKVKQVDFEDYLKNRRSGGLGIHLIKELMDEVEFEHHNGVSTISVIKHISGFKHADN